MRLGVKTLVLLQHNHCINYNGDVVVVDSDRSIPSAVRAPKGRLADLVAVSTPLHQSNAERNDHPADSTSTRTNARDNKSFRKFNLLLHCAPYSPFIFRIKAIDLIRY